MSSHGKILVSYHKKYPLLEGDFFLPVHVGRAAPPATKDGTLSEKERAWLTSSMIGDDTGDNISARNREFSECTALYWFWKNYDFQKLSYAGVFSYRRQLILNDLLDCSPASREKDVYKCVHLDKKSNVCKAAGINEDRILELLSRYDCILPLRTSLEKNGIRSVYEDYMKLIPGVHVSDLCILEDVFDRVYPEQAEKLREYLYSPNKLMYQVFITKPQILNAYCEWLFHLLFLTDPLIDASGYSINGRRTMGYLAEILYGYYFTNLIPQESAFFTGVTYLE